MARDLHFSLSQLPARYQRQVARQLDGLSAQPSVGEEGVGERGVGEGGVVGKAVSATASSGKESNEKKKSVVYHKPRTPNKIEAEYNRLFLQGKGLYEAVTFHLKGGCRYTPDWMFQDPDTGHISFIEVKGAHRFPTEGRSVLAFRETAALHPYFTFTWAKCTSPGHWTVKETLNPQGELPS